MPIYEYRCKRCGTTFTHNMSMSRHDKLASFLAHPSMLGVSESEADVLRCPRCRDLRVEQQMSSFYAKTTRKY